MRGAIALYAFAALVLVGCSEKKEQPTYSRVPGLESAPPKPLDQQQATAATPDVNMASLAPGKPLAGSPTGPTGDASGTVPLTQASAPPMAGGIPAAPETKVLIGGNKLQVAQIAFTVPEGWTSTKPTSSFRKAQYDIPGPGGPAELAVFYFGPGQGGSVEDNVKRWAGQFSSDDPTTTAVPVDVAELPNGDISLALVRASGTYNPGSTGMGMGAAAAPKPNYGLFGLVVSGGPEGPVFARITGPKATMDDQAKNFEAFARSAKKSNFH
jgi:hypothetical protein